MEYPYTVKSLATKVNKTEQSLQKFLKKNSEFINQHTLKTGRFKRYDQAVMDLVIDYYKLPQDLPAPETAEEPAENAGQETEQNARITELESSLKQKDSEIKALQDKLSQSEAERQEMIRQNAALLLLLQEEKQEKLLLLPAPKKSFVQRLKGIFKSDSDPQENSPKQS